MLAEMVKGIGCEVTEVSAEYNYVIFKNKEKWYEIDTHPFRGSCTIVLCELEQEPTGGGEIKVNGLLYKGEIHDPDSLNKVKEIIQQNDGSGTNKQ